MRRQVEDRSFELEGKKCQVKAFAADTGYEVRSIIDGKLIPICYSITWDDMTYGQMDWQQAVKALMDIAETDIQRKIPPAV